MSRLCNVIKYGGALYLPNMVSYIMNHKFSGGRFLITASFVPTWLAWKHYVPYSSTILTSKKSWVRYVNTVCVPRHSDSHNQEHVLSIAPLADYCRHLHPKRNEDEVQPVYAVCNLALLKSRVGKTSRMVIEGATTTGFHRGRDKHPITTGNRAPSSSATLQGDKKIGEWGIE